MDKKKFIDLCKEGDEQALNLLYKIYSGKMMKICLRYVSDDQVVQDLMHDGFIIIFTSIKTLRYPEKLESWMGMIMRNISLKYLNQRYTINTISLSEVEEWEEPVYTQPSDYFPPHAVMLKMIERLPDGYRKVFKLAVLEGLSHKEIGLILGIAPHSSSSQLFRAKEMLRKFIVEYSIIIILLLILIFPVGTWLNVKKEITKKNKRTELKKEKNTQATETSMNNRIPPGLPPIPNNQYAHLKTVMDTTLCESVFKDSTIALFQIEDTISIANNAQLERTKRQKRHNTNLNYSSNKMDDWSFTIAYSGGENQTKTKHSTIPGDVTSEAPEEVEEKIHHYMPITLSFSLYKKLNELWGIETGIRYTHLRTDFSTITQPYSERTQRINYLGIPIKGVLQVWKHRNISIYASTGVALDIPIKATSEETHMGNGESTDMKKQHLNIPLQWSVDLGVGFQYHITPSIGIYIAPNIHYYFNNGTQLNTIRKESPFDISLPVGIRFSW